MDLPELGMEFEWRDSRELIGDLWIPRDGLDGYGKTDSDRWAYSRTWNVNPATGQPWTVAEVNALQAGMKIESGTTMFVHVTQLYVSVNLGDTVTYTHTDHPFGMNQLTSMSGAQSASFTYTPNGDLATKTEAGVTWTYAYNEMGLLASVKQGATTVAQYSYDGLGRRVKTVEGSTTTYFVYGSTRSGNRRGRRRPATRGGADRAPRGRQREVEVGVRERSTTTPPALMTLSTRFPLVR